MYSPFSTNTNEFFISFLEQNEVNWFWNALWNLIKIYRLENRPEIQFDFETHQICIKCLRRSCISSICGTHSQGSGTLISKKKSVCQNKAINFLRRNSLFLAKTSRWHKDRKFYKSNVCVQIEKFITFAKWNWPKAV